MANPTTEHPTPAARQAHTPGVDTQGDPNRDDLEGHRPPVLFDDIDKVLLVRVLGEDVDISAAREKALAQGIATMQAGVELEESRIEFDPTATASQKKRQAVARAEKGVKDAEHASPEIKEIAAAELKRAQAMPEDDTRRGAGSGTTQTNGQKKAAAIAKAQQAVKDAEHGTQEQKDAAAAALKHAQAMPG